jgi:hypothetical protein
MDHYEVLISIYAISIFPDDNTALPPQLYHHTTLLPHCPTTLLSHCLKMVAMKRVVWKSPLYQTYSSVQQCCVIHFCRCWYGSPCSSRLWTQLFSYPWLSPSSFGQFNAWGKSSSCLCSTLHLWCWGSYSNLCSQKSRSWSNYSQNSTWYDLALQVTIDRQHFAWT